MLQQASRRASGWKAPSICHEGLLNTLPPGRQYELIVACSVLHHVPDLSEFLAAVRGLQAAGGLFMHLQDPNGDFLGDPELRQRMTRASRISLPEWAGRFTPRRIFGRIARELTGKQGSIHAPSGPERGLSWRSRAAAKNDAGFADLTSGVGRPFHASKNLRPDRPRADGEAGAGLSIQDEPGPDRKGRRRHAAVRTRDFLDHGCPRSRWGRRLDFQHGAPAAGLYMSFPEILWVLWGVVERTSKAPATD